MSDRKVGGGSAVLTGGGGGDIYVNPQPSGSLTINLNFDASWSVQPSGLTTTSGTKSYPDVGFADLATQQAMEAVVNQWTSDFKKFVKSTGTINLEFGMGRLRSPNSGSFFATTAVVALHSEVPTPDFTYAQYITELQTLQAVQQNLYTQPGSFPSFSGTINRSLTSSTAAIYNNTVDTNFTSVGFATNGTNGMTGFTWDTDPNTTTCGASKVKFYRQLWHEVTQAMARGAKITPIANTFYRWNYQLAWTAVGTQYIDGGASGYFSVDGGVTNLGAIQGPTGDVLDLSSGTTSAFAFNTPASSAGIPGSPLIIPGGNTLPLRSPNDAILMCALFPPTAMAKTLAGF